MVMNHFKMKPDTMYYHLGGMGCAAGISAPALAAKLLGSCRKKGYAIVVMHENITNNVYTGKDPSFLHSSVIARLGGSAVLLSTEPEERCNAKYVLEHVVRSVTAADSEATEYCHLTLDGEKNLGVYTPPAEKVQEIAAGAVKLTMRQLGE